MANTHFSGPVVSAGGFTGNVTGNLTGMAFQGAVRTPIVLPGAIPLTPLVSKVYTDGSAVAFTLAAGTAGQMKFVVYSNVTNDGTRTHNATIAPTRFANGTNFVLNAQNEKALLVSDGSHWHMVYTDGTITA